LTTARNRFSLRLSPPQMPSAAGAALVDVEVRGLLSEPLQQRPEMRFRRSEAAVELLVSTGI
jgi:hypothetical protein